MSRTILLLLASFTGMFLVGCNPNEPGGSGNAGVSSAAPEAPGSGSPAPVPPPPGDSPAPRNSSPARADDSMFLARAAHIAEGEGQITLNNPWTTADLAGNQVAPVDWKTTRDGNFRWQGTTYTTLVSQYRERRKQCERDSQVTFRQRYPDFAFGPDDDPDQPICYPTLVTGPTCLAVFNPLVAKSRYGYWCGAGHPAHGAGAAIAEQPLDAVDFCCMLHDAQTWGADTAGDHINERGITMCLYMATQYPAGAIDKLPDVETARQWWYDCSAGIISGDQFNDAPPPVVRR